MANTKQPRILVVAGSDSGGGAGIQADIKTITVLGGYAMTAVTALTAQNTEGVEAVMPVPGEFVARQMSIVLDDIGADAIKIGMLANEEIVEAVAGVLEKLSKKTFIVLDTVMVATQATPEASPRREGGHALLEESAIEALKTKLVPLADVITPNIPEAEVLTRQAIKTVADMKVAAQALLKLGPKAVLMKGGHLEGDEVIDVLVTPDKETIFQSGRIKTRHNHGTGCTLASAVAYQLASGLSLEKAVEKAREYVLKALRSAPGFGKGNGPLGHNLTD